MSGQTRSTLSFNDDFLKAAIFGELSDDEWTEATSDDEIVEFTAAIKSLIRDIQIQLEEYKLAEKQDPEWRTKATTIFRKGSELLMELNLMVKRRNVRVSDTNRANLFAAICAHREAIKADPDLEPSPADRKLWATLNQVKT
jgi:hypothetical protein